MDSEHWLVDSSFLRLPRIEEQRKSTTLADEKSTFQVSRQWKVDSLAGLFWVLLVFVVYLLICLFTQSGKHHRVTSALRDVISHKCCLVVLEVVKF